MNDSHRLVLHDVIGEFLGILSFGVQSRRDITKEQNLWFAKNTTDSCKLQLYRKLWQIFLGHSENENIGNDRVEARREGGKRLCKSLRLLFQTTEAQKQRLSSALGTRKFIGPCL